jgi:Helix-turn-helix domain
MTRPTDDRDLSEQSTGSAIQPGKYESWGVEEAAAFLRIHPETLTYRARIGEIPGCKVGRSWVFMPDLLANYLRTKSTEKYEKVRVRGCPHASLAQRLAARREQRLAGKRSAEAKRLATSKEGDTHDGHGRFLPGCGRPSLK